MTRSLLVLSHRVPYPPHNGAALRTYNMLRLLSRDFALVGLCFDRRDRATAHFGLDRRLAGLAPFGRFEAFPIPQETSRARLGADHLRSLLTGRPYTWYVHDSAPFIARLRTLLDERQWDVIHVDSLDLVRALPELPLDRVICTHHNVESMLLVRRGGAYLKYQARLIERAERYWLPRVALNIAVSPEDESALRAMAPAAPIATVPNGVDTEYFTPADGPGTGCVFVGGTSWYPNRDALHWFVEEIRPRLGTDAVVTWVGRATDAERQAFANVGGLSLTGYVDDIRPYVASAACYIAPLRVGGGTRLKLLDAFAMGKAVVSTSIGAEGLGAKHGENILLADTAESFAEATAAVLRDEALRRRLGAAARATAEQRFSWEVIGAAMRELYQVVAEGRAG